VKANGLSSDSLSARVAVKLGLDAARLFGVALGCAAIAWGAYTCSNFWRHTPIERIAGHVIAGDPFKTRQLTDLSPTLDMVEHEPLCGPDTLHSVAVLRLRLLEIAMDEGEGSIDAQMQTVRDSVRRSLACSPADPFLWTVLYWVETAQNGFRPEYLAYLRLSYLLGPNEGWVALKRNRLALAIFGQLPPDLAEMTVAEFASLLNSGFDSETAEILEGPGWKVRDRLLSGLKDVRESHRQIFAKILYRNGYNVSVPGVKLSDPRPWD